MKEAGVCLITRVPQLCRYPMSDRREILTVSNRHYGKFSLPGGKVDPEDLSPKFTAKRELREETGLMVTTADLVPLFAQTNFVTGEERMVHVFHVVAVIGQPKNVEEGTEFRWMTFEQLLDESNFAPFYKKYLPAGADHLVPTVFLTP